MCSHLSVAVGMVSKFETPELKRDLEKAAKSAEEEAEVSTLVLPFLCLLDFSLECTCVPSQLMQSKHVLMRRKGQ